jgi:hypothetical protein
MDKKSISLTLLNRKMANNWPLRRQRTSWKDKLKENTQIRARKEETNSVMTSHMEGQRGLHYSL